MPRSTWNGSLSFGLIHLPISLYTAVRDQDVSFRQLCPVHKKPISMKRVCAGEPEGAEEVETAHEVAHADLVSGFETGPDEFVVLTKADFERAALPIGKSFDIRLCVPEAAVDLRFFDKPYLVGPQKPAAARPYALLREALRRTGMVAVGVIALKSRQQVAAIRVMGDALVLHLMHWPDELVDLGEFSFPAGADLQEAEVGLAEQLVHSLAGSLATAGFRDEYRENLERLITARMSGEELEFETAEEPAATAVTDLVAILQASIAAKKAAA
ncbi:MAG TPA: Ku protein [Longimicrobium sp.]|jgi:DNA end-binding protein Ku